VAERRPATAHTAHGPRRPLARVLQAIPAHCWERSLVKSFGSLFLDLAMAAALVYASSWIDSPAVPRWAAPALWCLYWYWQVGARAASSLLACRRAPAGRAQALALPARGAKPARGPPRLGAVASCAGGAGEHARSLEQWEGAPHAARPPRAAPRAASARSRPTQARRAPDSPRSGVQGAVCTGLWVIAHECGHGAFSAIGWVNDAVGFTVHSCLLVPYYSW
jgi:hypothetical protein